MRESSGTGTNRPRMQHFNPANILSLSRILLTPPIFLLLLAPWQEGYFVGGWLFMLAVTTDMLDGYLARRGKSTSSLGVFLDLVADKVLILAILGLLGHQGLVPVWMAVIIAAREVAVMALRWAAAARGKVIPAAAWGKGKTVITSVGIAAVIMGESLGRGDWAKSVNFGNWLYMVADISGPLMAAATALTLVSGALYVLAARETFRRTAHSKKASDALL